MLERQWYKKPIDQLLQAMTDAENHVRLSAVSAIPLFVVKLRAKSKPAHDNDDDDDDGGNGDKDLETDILNGIEALLVDPSPYVCLAAAAVLFSLGNLSNFSNHCMGPNLFMSLDYPLYSLFSVYVFLVLLV